MHLFIAFTSEKKKIKCVTVIRTKCCPGWGTHLSSRAAPMGISISHMQTRAGAGGPLPLVRNKDNAKLHKTMCGRQSLAPHTLEDRWTYHPRGRAAKESSRETAGTTVT